MEADRWLGLDLRHLVALKTIADEGLLRTRGRASRLHAVGHLATDRDARTHRRPPSHRAPWWPPPDLAHGSRADPPPSRGRHPGTAPRRQGGHGGARGRRRRTPPRRDVPERRREDHPPLAAPIFREPPARRGRPPRVAGRERAPRDDRARRPRPDVLDTSGRQPARTRRSSCCAIPTSSSFRQARPWPRSNARRR